MYNKRIMSCLRHWDFRTTCSSPICGRYVSGRRISLFAILIVLLSGCSQEAKFHLAEVKHEPVSENSKIFVRCNSTTAHLNAARAIEEYFRVHSEFDSDNATKQYRGVTRDENLNSLASLEDQYSECKSTLLAMGDNSYTLTELWTPDTDT
jgi:hypothetical protein